MVEVGCGRVCSPVSHLAWLFPVPDKHILAERRPTGASSPPFSLTLVSISFTFYPSLSFWSCLWIELPKAFGETFIKHPHSQCLEGQRVIAPAAPLAGREVHVFHPSLSPCVLCVENLNPLLFLWVPLLALIPVGGSFPCLRCKVILVKTTA